MSDDGNPAAITNTRVEAIAEYLDGHGVGYALHRRHEVRVPSDVADRARVPIERMVALA